MYRLQFSIRRWLGACVLVAGCTAAPGLCAEEGAADPARPQPAKKMPRADRVVVLDMDLAGDRVVAVGERGIVLYSDDEGESWSQADVPISRTITAVDFLDERRGFAVGHDSALLRTDDGGASWSLQKFAPEDENFFLEVDFPTPERGYILGTNGELWISRDGGESWELTVLAVEEWYSNHLFGIAGSTDGTTLIVAEKGVFYRSPNGLDDWQPLESPYEGSYFGVLSVGDRWLAYGMSGRAYISDDLGDSWTRVQTGTQQFLLDGVPVGDGGALLVGRGGVMLYVDLAAGTSITVRREDRLSVTAVQVLDEWGLLATETGGVTRVPRVEILAR